MRMSWTIPMVIPRHIELAWPISMSMIARARVSGEEVR